MQSEITLQGLLTAWLVFSWLFVTGAAALLAVTGRWHWMIRCACLAGVFSPALMAGAYEIYWLSSLSVGMSISFIAVIRRCGVGRQLADDEPVQRANFSIGTALYVTALLAAGTAIVMRTPTLNPRAWISLALISITLAALTALSFYTVFGRHSWTLRWAMVAGIATLVMLPVSLCDWLLASLTSDLGWPPDLTVLTFIGVPLPAFHLEWMWFGIGAVTLLALVLWLSSLSMAWGVRRISITSTLFALTMPPLFAALPLLSVPEFPPPLQDDAYAEVAAVSAKLAESGFALALARYGDWQAIPATRLSVDLDAIESELLSLSEQLNRPMSAPIDGRFEDLPIADIIHFRTATRAIVAWGRRKIRLGDQAAAVQAYLSALRMGVRTRHRGLLVHQLSGIAISGIGLRALYFQQTQLDDAARVTILRELLESMDEIESPQATLARERVWMMRQGWHNYLYVLLSDWSGESHQGISLESQQELWLREQCMFRLLAVEIAIQCFMSKNGRPPKTLDELVPVWLSNVPRDVHAANGAALKYLIRDNGNYLLYSVGRDGVDDGGSIAESWSYAPQRNGDLSLEAVYSDTKN